MASSLYHAMKSCQTNRQGKKKRPVPIQTACTKQKPEKPYCSRTNIQKHMSHMGMRLHSSLACALGR